MFSIIENLSYITKNRSINCKYVNGYIPSFVVCVSFFLIIFSSLLLGKFTIAYSEIFPTISAIFIIYSCGLAFYKIKMPIFGDFFKIFSIFFLIAILMALSCAVLTITSFPYADDNLAAADRYLGFDWPATFSFLAAHPILSEILAKAYISLNWEPQILIFLLCIFQSSKDAYRFLTAWAVAMAITLVIYPFFPAVAAFHHYHIDPTLMPDKTSWASWNLDVIMEGLRTGSNNILGYEEFTGIVTMPSFHAAAAILLIWGSWAFRWLRWPSLALNSVMFVSAVPIGGHYLVDILAGLAIAIFAAVLANAIHRQLDMAAAVRLIRQQQGRVPIAIEPIPICDGVGIG